MLAVPQVSTVVADEFSVTQHLQYGWNPCRNSQ